MNNRRELTPRDYDDLHAYVPSSLRLASSDGSDFSAECSVCGQKFETAEKRDKHVRRVHDL